MKLAVNEIFGPTIQGEGKSTGKEVVFLRLSGCNLACIWCDTPYTWNWTGTKFQHKEKYEIKDEVTKSEIEEVLIKLREIGQIVKSLVISGGEPLLQQKALIPLCQELKNDGWWIEIETNGTKVIEDQLLDLVDQVNCSPKLSNSGVDNPVHKRINLQALLKFRDSEKCYFKFVVSSVNDMSEIILLLREIHPFTSRIYLMPEGRTKDEQIIHQGLVKRLAENLGFKFSAREHILQFGAKRGV